MKNLLSIEYHCYKLHTLLRESSAQPSSLENPLYVLTSFLQGNLEEIMQWAILSDLRTLTKKQSAGL